MNIENRKGCKILYVISGLGLGGAERALLRLCSSQVKDGYTVHVLRLTRQRDLQEKFVEAGVDVLTLDLRSGIWGPSFLQFNSVLKKFKPSVVVSWMYHADFFVSLAKILLQIKIPIVWSVRTADPLNHSFGPLTRFVIFFCKVFSHFVPKRIVYCGLRALELHESFGYSAKSSVVIPNGLPQGSFEFSSEGRQSFRTELGLSEDILLVGLVARWDPIKDFGTFISAAQEIQKQIPNTHFVLVGDRLESSNLDLVNMIQSLGLTSRFSLLGRRSDLNVIYSGLDLFMLSSSSEGFPNVLIEAMSCSCPCVSTDVGDAEEIIGRKDFISPPQDPARLALCAIKVLQLSRVDRDLEGRRVSLSIKDRYTLDRVKFEYDRVLREVISSNERL